MTWKKLTGGSVNTVYTNGDLVRRKLSDWSPAIHKLINHITNRKINYVPAIVEVDNEFEYIEFMKGVSALKPWPKEVKDDEWVKNIGVWLKDYHQIVKNFNLDKEEFAWGTKKKGTNMIPCHGDLGPWNILHEKGTITAIIDWDLARWGTPLDNLTQVALENIPLRQSTKDTMGEGISREILEKRLRVLCGASGDVSPKEVINNSLVHLLWMKKEVSRLNELGVKPFTEFVDRGFLEIYDRDYLYISENWNFIK